MPDYLDTARKAVEDQLSKLRDEVSRLESAAAALGGARRGPGRPRGSGKAASKKTAARKTTTRRRTAARGGARRKRRGGTRAEQAQALVKANPGIAIPELATKMGIKQNYLYRVMPSLQKEKKVVKRGKGWHSA